MDAYRYIENARFIQIFFSKKIFINVSREITFFNENFTTGISLVFSESATTDKKNMSCLRAQSACLHLAKITQKQLRQFFTSLIKKKLYF